jgi:lantibiotic transport system permease protein
MTALARALSAEVLKMKRTLALLVALALPLVVILMNFFMFMRWSNFADDFNGWDFFVNNNMSIWVVLMLPLYVTLETALLAGLEHSPQGWKHLAALPIPRGAVYAAKQVIAMAMVALSMVVVVAATWASATLAYRLNLNPGAPFEGSFPLVEMSRGMLLAYLLSLLIIAIHTWVATRFASFPLASGIGIAATIMSFLIINDNEVSRIFPWTLPLNAMTQLLDSPVDLTLPLSVSLIGAVLVSVIGGWNVISRDVL